MIIIISPAKKLDFENAAPVAEFTNLRHLSKAQLLINALKKCSPSEISKMMKLSGNLTELNIKRYKSFKTPLTLKNAKQAIFAFKGDTYVGLDPDSMKSSDIKFAQKHLRILSGLYGIISPLDLIAPYRLEMGTKFTPANSKNLYQFWSDDITSELEKEKFIVNLASKEYFSVINTKKLSAEIITPTFKENKNGELKIISFLAKKARGMMSRYIIENKIKDPIDLQQFNAGGYKFNPNLSSFNVPVFTRKL